MRGLKEAIHQTVQYSQSFGLVPDTDTIHRYLISPKTHPLQIVTNLTPALTMNQQKAIHLKQEISKNKIDKATQIANLLSKIPSIKLICATGSIAIDNADKNADLDLFMVTSTDTLWLTRPLVFLILKVLRRRRSAKLTEHNSKKVKDKVCDNLWLDESALKIPQKKRNLYTAHEVLQAKPLFDRGGYYQKFIRENSWTKTYLANAYAAAICHSCEGRNPSPPSFPRRRAIVPFMGESIWRWIPASARMTNRALSFINRIFFFLQFQYMKPKITHETITLHSAFFHPNSPASSLREYSRGNPVSTLPPF